MPTIKDVARDAGVSVATVSYILNQTRYVSPALTARVVASLKKLNYSINPVARNLRCQKSHTVGVVLQDITNLFFPPLLAGLQQTLRESGMSLLYFSTHGDTAEELAIIRNLQTMWVDGIILDSCFADADAKPLLECLNGGTGKKRIPVVFLERDFETGKNGVLVDNASGGAAAAEHLLALGRKNNCMLCGKQDWRMFGDRVTGYRRAMEKAGQIARVEYCDFTAEDAYTLTRRLLQSDSPPDGIFAAADRMAVGTLKALAETGLRVPEDVAVVGFDGTFIASLIKPALTSVHVPGFELGQRAAQQMLRLIETGKPEKSVTLPVDLQIRASSDTAAVNEWQLTGW